MRPFPAVLETARGALRASLRPALRTSLRPVLAALAPLALALVAGLLPAGAAAQPAYPSRTVTLLVPYPAGGGTDAIARTLSQALATHWKQPVIVENVGGADGMIGTQKALRAPADGHTLLLQLTNTMLLWKATMPGAKDLLAEVRFLSMIQRAPLAFAVATKFPGETFADFVAHCRRDPCSIGSATRYAQLVGRHLADAAGIPQATSVAYKGGAPMLTDTVGGHVTMSIPSVASGQPLRQAGALRYLAVGSAERFPLAPEVPTLAESGLDVVGESSYGLMVSRATPPELVAAIVDALKAVSRNPALLATIEQSGGLPVFNTPDEFDAYLRREQAYLDRLLTRYRIGD